MISAVFHLGGMCFTSLTFWTVLSINITEKGLPGFFPTCFLYCFGVFFAIFGSQGRNHGLEILAEYSGWKFVIKEKVKWRRNDTIDEKLILVSHMGNPVGSPKQKKYNVLVSPSEGWLIPTCIYLRFGSFVCFLVYLFSCYLQNFIWIPLKSFCSHLPCVF